MRLAGQVKMGYYPTPITVVERLRKLISFPTYGTQTVLDPCCGEGLALEALAKGTKGETYGIELDGERAKEAERRLRHVFRAGYEEVEIPPASMSLLYLNPPYDDGEGERKELTFLRDTIDTLVPSGILVYIIPQTRLSAEIAALLAANLTQTRIYRFPDPEFDAFGQIVVLGKKTEWPTENVQETNRLFSQRNADLDSLPPSSSSWAPFTAPPAEATMLRVRSVRPADLVKMAEASPLSTRIRNLIEPAVLDSVGQPPTRLHVGHLGLLLSAGRLNGLVGKGKDRHVVVGKPVKHIVETNETEEEPDGSTVQIEKRLETFKVTIKMLLPTGEIRRLT